MNHKKHIKVLPVKELSGYHPKPGAIPFVKKSNYFIVTNISITGDAPKDFIRYYHYGESNKVNTNNWPYTLQNLETSIIAWNQLQSIC